MVLNMIETLRHEREKMTCRGVELICVFYSCYWLSMVNDSLHLDTPVKMFYI